MEENSLKKMATLREMILSVIVMIALFLVFFKMVYSPGSEKIASLKSESNQVSTEVKALERQISTLRQQHQKVEAVKIEATEDIRIQILKGAIKPEITEMSDLIQTISEVDFTQGVTIDSVSYKSLENKPDYSSIPLIVKAHGSFKRLVAFLNNLDKKAVLFSMDSVIIATDPIVTGEMNLEIFGTLYQTRGLHGILQEY